MLPRLFIIYHPPAPTPTTPAFPAPPSETNYRCEWSIVIRKIERLKNKRILDINLMSLTMQRHHSRNWSANFLFALTELPLTIVQ